MAMMIVGILLAVAAPVAAQDGADDPAAEPGVTVADEAAPAEAQLVKDDDTSATVQRIRRELIAIAAVTTVGLVIFVWHTSPSRRLRVATRRAETTPVDAGGD